MLVLPDELCCEANPALPDFAPAQESQQGRRALPSHAELDGQRSDFHRVPFSIVHTDVVAEPGVEHVSDVQRFNWLVIDPTLGRESVEAKGAAAHPFQPGKVSVQLPAAERVTEGIRLVPEPIPAHVERDLTAT